ncbi:MAG: hypothetical protein LAN71_16795 [Acidobacteriia bacterium]|nr:hypothetical protein [Terriglobia bacterium]
MHDAKQAFKEIARVTKPGGKIVIADSYWNSLKIDGIPNEDSEIVKKAYLGFIKNPSIAANLKDLFLAEGFTEKDISQEIMKLEFHGLQELELVLWIKPSLELGEKVGVITADEGLHVLQEIQATQESKIKTSFDLYIIKGIKP